MTLAVQDITCKGEVFTLTNQRVVFWAREKSLILSDLHVGKSATFRRHGIPIPKTVLEDDLQRLKALIEHFKAKRLIIVGDLFHAEYNQDMAYFKAWLSEVDISVDLITGNHDRLPKRIYDDLQLKVFKEEQIIAPIQFVHDAVELLDDHFTVSGHTHPGVLIRGKGRQTIKLPCFQVTEQQLILPAFSQFTGLNTRDFPEDCECYAFTESSIFKV